MMPGQPATGPRLIGRRRALSVKALGLCTQRILGWHSSMRARQALGVGATTLAIFVLAPAVATAAIIPGYGIAGLKLGESTARVTALLGKPGQLQKNSGGEQNWLYFGKGPVDWGTIQAKGAKKTVEGLETSD